MADELIVVFGGSGFVGRYVIKELARRGKRVRVPMRRPHLGQDLRVLGDVGQIQLVQANVRFPESIDRALDGATGVVNLVGVLSEKGPQTFFNIHAEGAATIAAMAGKRGLDRFVHVSALGAGRKSRARYAKTKTEAEEAVRAAIPSSIVLRPSVMFGAEDSFFNRFAAMAKVLPVLPLPGFGSVKFQPLYVGDFAEAVANALDNRAARGRTFELGGPRVYSFKQLMQFITDTIDRPRMLAPVPLFIMQLMGAVCGALFRLQPLPIDPPLTADQMEMLRADNVVQASGALGTIADLGVESLETIEALAPGYLWRFRPHGQFQPKPAA
jgi:NADH dehydrogenase